MISSGSNADTALPWPPSTMTRIITFAAIHLILLGEVLLHAEDRSWRSATGNQSFRAEFVSSDGSTVLLRKSDRTTVTVALKNLHPADRDWVEQHLRRHQARAEARITGECFDTLAFGDKRTTVEKKLRNSPAVIKTLDDRLVVRTGLNGIYRTLVAGVEYHLFFQWDDNDGLQEVTLRGKDVASEEYATELQKQWQDLVSMLTESHGSPAQTTGYPPSEDLTSGQLLGSHLWHTKNSHSILLCTGQNKDEYLVAIRFSANKISPNALEEVPAKKPAKQPVGP